jgi:tetratricopeptide (TPR) repeat protein
MKTREQVLKLSIYFVLTVWAVSPSYTQTKPSTDSVLTFLNNYQYTKALNILNRPDKINNDSKQWYYLTGTAYKGLYQFSNAIESYKKVLAKDTADTKTIIEIANTYKQIPDNENAIRYYVLAAKYDTANIAFNYEIANCKFALDQYPEALSDYRAIFKQDTSNLFLLKKIAMCYFKVGQIDSSIVFYYKCLGLNAKDATSVSNICNLLLLKKGYDEGIQLTEAYQQIDSNNARINSLNAYFYLLKEKFQIAVNKFKACLDNNDTSRFVLKNGGIAYYRAESYDTAKYYLEKAYFQDTTDITNLHFLGLACSKSFYKRLGVEYLEKAISLYNPTIEKLANIYLNTSEACDAWSNCPAEKKITINQKALYYNPNEKNFLLKLALVYDYSLKDTAKAIEYYSQYIYYPLPVEKDKDLKYETVKKRLDKLKVKK